MAWIKRNLFFLIGSLIALGLMGAGIFYLLGNITAEHDVVEDIQKQYEELKRLAQLKPHPGNDKIDNIKAAKDQEAALRDYIKKERAIFAPVPSIPDTSSNKISSADFVHELQNTVAELRRSAASQSVELPSDYYFSFKSQHESVKFEAGTLDKLASHLGEIKTLCDILFTAKINLDSIQREVISSNQDSNLSDYLTQKTVSTPLADITPYRVTFRCFSADLAQVLSALATSQYGFSVQSINVESAAAEETPGGAFGAPAAVQPVPQYNPNLPGGGRYPVLNGRPGVPAPGVAPAAAAPRTVNVLYEKPFRVSLMIELIKPKAPEVAQVTPARPPK
jgi:hypothetical protein